MQQRTAGLLLSARRGQAIIDLLHGTPAAGAGCPVSTAPKQHSGRSAANASSVTFTAAVEGNEHRLAF